MRALLDTVRHEIAASGGLWRWLTDGLALIFLWAGMVVMVFFLDALHAPVPQ